MRSFLGSCLLAALPRSASAASAAAPPVTADMGAGIPANAERHNSLPAGTTEMMIEAPVMTEEDQYGYNMPPQYRCNACRAVIWHVNRTIADSHPTSRTWKEWEVEEVMQKACRPDEYDGYGIKKIGGENALSGVALKAEEEELLGGQASIQMGGDSWKKRMAEVCRTIVNDDLEDEVYALWRAGDLTEKKCYEKKYCSKKKADAKKKEKSDADKKKAEEKAAKKREKAAEKAAKKKEKASKGAEKRVSLEVYMRKLARANGWSEDRFTKARSEADWSADLAGVNLALPAGRDEL